MNEADYNAKKMELDGLTISIESLISRFNKDTVSLLDLGTFRDELKEIFNAFIAFERKYLELRGKMDRNLETDILRLNDLMAMHQRAKKRVVDNEVEVKAKLQELQNASIHATTKDEDKIKKDKIQLKLKHAVEKFKTLKKCMDDLGDVKDMSEHRVRECLVDSKEWKKELRSFRECKESIDLELLGVDIDDEKKTEFEDS